jgi:hypothetical protein
VNLATLARTLHWTGPLVIMSPGRPPRPYQLPPPTYPAPSPEGPPPLGLDALAADPARAANLSLALAGKLLVRAATVLAALGAVSWSDTGPSTAPNEPDRLLTADEAAQILGVNPKWLSRQRWPFTRKLSNKVVRYSEAGLTRWLASRKLGHK